MQSSPPGPPFLTRPALVLPLFFLILFGGAMALGPLLYYALHWLSPVPIPFHRAMDRALLASAVYGLYVFRGRLKLRAFWPWRGGEWKLLLLGFVFAAVTAQAMIGFDLAFAGFTSAHLTSGAATQRVLLAVVAALLIPPLEETIFRGFLQGELIRGLGWRAGWILAAFIYMLAHFLKIPVEIDREFVRPWSGATALGAAFVPVLHGEFLCGRGLNLFLAGLIFGGLYLRVGSLWVNAGLHSGWILALLIFTGFTRPVDPPYNSFLAGDLLSTPLTSVVFIMLGFWLWRYFLHPSIVPETGPSAP